MTRDQLIEKLPIWMRRPLASPAFLPDEIDHYYVAAPRDDASLHGPSGVVTGGVFFLAGNFLYEVRVSLKREAYEDSVTKSVIHVEQVQGGNWHWRTSRGFDDAPTHQYIDRPEDWGAELRFAVPFGEHGLVLRLPTEAEADDRPSRACRNGVEFTEAILRRKADL